MPTQHVLTINAGSSSLKYALFERDTLRRVLSAKVERIGSDRDYAAALSQVLGRLEPHGGAAAIAAVGHRVVHGGPRWQRPAAITPPLVCDLRELSALDPDHLPAEIALIEAMAKRLPSTPQIACFDTAFHESMPRVARILPVPRRYETQGLRRYGFHGLSYRFLCDELARVAGQRAANGRVVLAHLGSGSSLAAVHEGRCVDTTMGFTPNSGVPMGTRSGDLEPGVLAYLLRREGLTPESLDRMLNHDSGLLGVSETSADMRDLLSREASDARAADAIALYCYQVRKAIGALAAALGGIEVLVFAGGIGENAPAVRERIVRGLEYLGIHLDPSRNQANEALVSRDASPCTARVIRTDEEFVIARETCRALLSEETK